MALGLMQNDSTVRSGVHPHSSPAKLLTLMQLVTGNAVLVEIILEEAGGY